MVMARKFVGPLGARSRQLLGPLMLVTSMAAQADSPMTALVTDGLLYSDDKVLGFPEPVDWQFARIRSRKVTDQNLAVVEAFQFTALTETLGDIGVSIWLLNGSRPSNRLQAIFERTGKIKAGHAHDGNYELTLQPVPQGTYRAAKRPSTTNLLVHRRANGRAMSITFYLPNDEVAKARPHLVALAQGVVHNLPLWPPRAPGFDYEKQSGFEIAFATDTKKADRSSIHRLIKDTVKSFTKRHGQPAMLKTEPVVVYVTQDGSRRAALLHRAGEQVGIDEDYGMRRLVTTTLHDHNVDGRAEFVRALYGYLLFTLYPHANALWMHWGETTSAGMQVECGKALPSVLRSWRDRMQRVSFSLDQTMQVPDALRPSDASAWTAFFRLGPAKYRKAYQAMLDELRTGMEPAAAQAKLLEAFDASKLQAAARKTLRKRLKVVKKK